MLKAGPATSVLALEIASYFKILQQARTAKRLMIIKRTRKDIRSCGQVKSHL